MQKNPVESFIQRVAELIEMCTGLPVDRNALSEGQSRGQAKSITLQKISFLPHDKAIVGRPSDLTFMVRLVGKDREQIAENVMESAAFGIINAMEPDNLDYECATVTLDRIEYIQDGDGDDKSVVPIELTFTAMLANTID